MTDWIYEPTPPMGGATGGAYANTISGTGMELGAVLAREAIQNSVDAADRDDTRVRVRFEARELRGAAKREFVTTAGLSDMRARLGMLKLPPSNCLASLDDDSVPIRNLLVEDFRTTGLVGDWRSDKSNFRRFLLSLGDGAKLEDEKRTGGSYGYGKSAYSSNSSIALSLFTAARGTPGINRLLYSWVAPTSMITVWTTSRSPVAPGSAQKKQSTAASPPSFVRFSEPRLRRTRASWACRRGTPTSSARR